MEDGSNDPRIRYAEVLVELGQLNRAELEIAEVLERSPEHLDALSLLAKIKHIRGQLSLAIACSAQVQSKRATFGDTARMHLESVLRLAQDPERGAGEFLAVGQNQLVQKPTAYLALEEAFRHYAARRPNEARAVCRQVATRYREKEPEVYKLAVLAESWICELIGDLAQAAEVLERLGQGRGYETDADRLVALANLYERMDTPESLAAAVKICNFLTRNFEYAPILGRLAHLHRRLGHDDDALTYERQHLEQYRHRMHRPTVAQVVEVAARRYLPIALLRSVAFDAPDEIAGASSLEQAVAHAIAGEWAAARDALDGASRGLELKYLADVEAQMNGELSDRAIELRAHVLREDPTDHYAVSWLLDAAARLQHPVILELFRDSDLAHQAVSALEAALDVDAGDPRRWRELATLYRLQPGGQEEARHFEERAAILEQSALERSGTIGRALSVGMYRYFGRIQGLVHEIWATRYAAPGGRGGMLRREDILGSVTNEMRDDIRNIFLAVREYVRAKFPHATGDMMEYDYSCKVTKEDEPSGGTSAGLPTAMAFVSLFIQRPVPQDVAFTGSIVTDAHDVLMLRPVGDVEYKVDAAYHRNQRMMVVPVGNRAQIEQSTLVPREISRTLVRYCGDLDGVVRLVFGEDAFRS